MKTHHLSENAFHLNRVRLPLSIDLCSEILGFYETFLIENLDNLVKRYKRDADYSWIDLKYNAVTGCEYKVSDRLRGKNTIYGWIQARALESMAVHYGWLCRTSTEHPLKLSIIDSLRQIIPALEESLETAESFNNGHITFSMNREGMAIDLHSGNILNYHQKSQKAFLTYSDIFRIRGYAAAYLYIGEPLFTKTKAVSAMTSLITALQKDQCSNDQMIMSANYLVGPDNERITHAPWMLSLGAMNLFAQAGIPEAVTYGINIMHHIIDNHVNTNSKWPELAPWDFVEFITPDKQPWSADGTIPCDPGHAAEFSGLGLACIKTFKDLLHHQDPRRKELSQLQHVLIHILLRSYQLGYHILGEGIVKLVDIVSGKPLLDEMPWWSLPETMRASLLASELSADTAPDKKEENRFLEIFSQCHNAFFSHYVQWQLPGFPAVQTRNTAGDVVDSIPAVPDLDPGYHTGIALIDCYACLQKDCLQPF